ncbi:N-acetylglucosaminylphosphatidylinositol de-n-acetylase family protein [Thalictrum thalictroides]|uniref:N-acetylglucosaminylphosphatidylinositol deacetylase n=1 Tax=Thalictrum thalictroides TaxID=46969 RepID=A0A7J6VIY4_THATH|nr:N-acetylglucosaminylphosphatidylinositol de-n-acetylase family protein [Thalictrum thalictroides]
MEYQATKITVMCIMGFGLVYIQYSVIQADLSTFLCEESHGSVDAWELVSTSIVRKYSGPLDVWLSIQSAKNSRGQMYCLLNKHPRKSFTAMAQHQSQWIWFRKLFVSFSSYTYINVLKKINL